MFPQRSHTHTHIHTRKQEIQLAPDSLVGINISLWQSCCVAGSWGKKDTISEEESLSLRAGTTSWQFIWNLFSNLRVAPGDAASSCLLATERCGNKWGRMTRGNLSSSQQIQEETHAGTFFLHLCVDAHEMDVFVFMYFCWNATILKEDLSVTPVCTDPAVAELLRREDDGSALFPWDSTENHEEEKKERRTNSEKNNWGTTFKKTHFLMHSSTFC